MSGCTYPNCACGAGDCTLTHTTYDRGHRYDHPDQTMQYLLDTMRAILQEIRELRTTLADWRP